jgi:hypothetical protein
MLGRELASGDIANPSEEILANPCCACGSNSPEFFATG